MSLLLTNSRQKFLLLLLENLCKSSDAFRVGADICTLPLPIFYKLYKHILTDKGLELFDQRLESTTGEYLMPRGIMNKVDILARVLKLKHELGEGEYDHQDYEFREGYG